MAGRTRTVALNTITNYIKFGVTMIIMLALTPFIIRMTGQEQFGLWSLVFSVLGFLGLLDMGLGTGVVKYSAEAKGNNDHQSRNAILSAIFFMYCILSALVAVAVFILALVFNSIMKIPESLHDTAILLLWILAARMVILNLPASLFRNILFGYQKIVHLNIIGIVSICLYGGLGWIVLSRGGGLVGLAWVNFAAMVFENICTLILAWRYVPNLKISFKKPESGLLKKVSSFSFYMFITNIAALIALKTDPLIIKLFLPLTAVAIYAIALKIAEYIHIINKQFINVLSPLIAELNASGDKKKVRFILTNCSKFALAPALIMGMGAILFAREGITLWVGQEFSSGAPVLIILVIAILVAIPQMMASNVLSMTGYHKITGRAALLSAVINVIVSISLVGVLGLAGVALGTLISAVIVDLFIIIRKALAVYLISPFQFCREVLIPLILPVLIQSSITLGLKHLFPPTNLLQLILLAIPGSIAFIAAFWFQGLYDYEKDMILKIFHKRRSSPEAVA